MGTARCRHLGPASRKQRKGKGRLSPAKKAIPVDRMKKKPYPARFSGHFSTICVHKFWVFYYCCKLGIPMQGITHDLSKFSPVEFFEGVRYYTGDTSPINTAKDRKGYSDALMHHKGRNKHHYLFWMDRFDNGGYNLMMPFKYALEQIADFMAAGRVYQKKAFTFQSEYNWWLNRKKQPLAMHPALQEFNTVCLKTMMDKDRFLTTSEMWHIYQDAVWAYQGKVEPFTLSTADKTAPKGIRTVKPSVTTRKNQG